MKLLRLSSNEPTAIFDNILNEDLIVEPYSKIALANLSFTNAVPSIVIDETNDTIVYNTGSGNRTAQLTHTTYQATSSDGILLFQDLEAQLNAQLRFLSGKEFGGEFEAGVGGGAITLLYKIAPFVWTENDGDNFGNFGYKGTFAISNNDGDPQRVATNSGVALDNDSARADGITPMVKGCGCFRTQINNLSTNNTANNGFGLVLTTAFADDIGTSLTAEQEKYSIRCIPDPSNLALFKYVKRDGSGNTTDVLDGAGNVLRPLNVTAGGDGFANAENDVISLDISQGSVNGRIYQTNAGVTTETLAFSVGNYNSENLLPILIIKGAQANCGLYNPKSHFRGADTPSEKFEVLNMNNEDDDYSRALSIPVPPDDRQSLFTLNLEGAVSYAQFLGFKPEANGRFIYTRPNYTNKATFQGGAGFQLKIFDCYTVEFMSSLLESYDGRSFRSSPPFTPLGTGGKFSILKVVPNVNANATDRVCNYEPSTLQFIDLNNSVPLTLRSIKARVLNTALEPITTEGVSVLTVLIKEKDEQV
jgi:hypothetical protein